MAAVPTMLVCKCGVERIIKCLPHRDYSDWMCRSCSMKKLWTNGDYRSHRPKKKPSVRAAAGSQEHRAKLAQAMMGRMLSPAHKLAISESVKALWKNQDYRNKLLAILTDDANRESRRVKSSAMWTSEFKARYQTSEYRAKVAAASKLLWQNDSYRSKVRATKSTPKFKALMARIAASHEYKEKLSRAAASLPSVSSLQLLLYSMLDDLNVKYSRETSDGTTACMVGPWSFDCMIKRPGQRTLLIECNGDWVHSLPHKQAADKAKATYVNSYCSDQYELKYLWEHQFASHQTVMNLLKYWLGIAEQELIEFKLEDVEIRTPDAADYRLLLQKYHYLANAGRGGIAYGAFLRETLIAVCVFSPLPRQNIDIMNFRPQEIRDLSRFCIHPNYQIKNFGSWFISRCIKLLPQRYRLIIAYADNTFGHNGGLYTASNFVCDKTVDPDYWYRSDGDWIMHKKTLYNKAINLNLTEAQYAERFGFRKVFGDVKRRFVFVRKQ